MLNKVMLIGRLGADPELNTLSNGGAVATANIATSRRWKDKQTGEQKEQTEWHRVVFFNQGNYKLAEIAGEYLKKGSLCYIEGRLQTRKWMDKNNIERYTTEIMAENMHMLESKGGSYKDNIPPASAYEQAQPAKNTAAAPNNAPDFDDDIPF